MPQGRKAAFRLFCWLAQQTDWVDGGEKTVPSTQLVCDRLARAKLRHLHKLLEQLFLRFVDMKLFANAMFCGCFVLVLDATKVEERRGSGLIGWRRNRMALEAKFITPWGWAITVAVEPMRQAGLDICRDNGWHHLFVFKEGRSPAVFKEAQSLLNLAEDQWGKMVGDVRAKKQCVFGGVRWAKDVPFGEYMTNVVEVHQLEATYLNHAYEDAYLMTS